MAEQETPRILQPAAGIQRPGIPGANNLLDPAVRDRLREGMHDILHQMVEAMLARLQGGMPQPGGPPAAAPTPAPAEPAKPEPNRAGPTPYGDVDLGFINANVPTEPVKPKRGNAKRSFYFLQQAPAAPATAEKPATSDHKP